MAVLERNRAEGPRGRPELADFARWLKGRMRERRLGRNQLAQYLGVSQSSISEYARALRRPRLETLRKMAVYFETPLEDIEALLPPDDASEQGATYVGWGPAVTAPRPDTSRPAALLIGPLGEIEGVGDLDREETEIVRAAIEAVKGRRRPDRGVGNADGGGAGPGDTR